MVVDIIVPKNKTRNLILFYVASPSKHRKKLFGNYLCAHAEQEICLASFVLSSLRGTNFYH